MPLSQQHRFVRQLLRPIVERRLAAYDTPHAPAGRAPHHIQYLVRSLGDSVYGRAAYLKGWERPSILMEVDAD